MADDQRPKDSASKAEWVAYAKSQGVDPSGTRDEIIARVDAAVTAGGSEHKPEMVTFPVHTVKVVLSGDEPVRAGGHVLTDHGWQVDTSEQGKAGA